MKSEELKEQREKECVITIEHDGTKGFISNRFIYGMRKGYKQIVNLLVPQKYIDLIKMANEEQNHDMVDALIDQVKDKYINVVVYYDNK